MNCGDVRELFSVLFDGKTGLTERALVEAHVTQCAACRQELEHREQAVRSSRRRLSPGPIPLKLVGGAATIVLVTALAVYLAHRPSEFQLAARLPVVPSESAAPSASPMPTQSTPAPPKQSTASPELRATDPMPTQPSAVASRPAQSQARLPTGPALPPHTETSEPGQVPRHSAISTEAKRGRPFRTESKDAARASQGVPPSTDVLGQLTVKDRSEAKRQLAGLLAGVDGTGTDWQHRGSSLTEVDTVVSQPNYSKFAEGLARIGFWQVEARRSPLPDMVRVKVRLTE